MRCERRQRHGKNVLAVPIDLRYGLAPANASAAIALAQFGNELADSHCKRDSCSQLAVLVNVQTERTDKTVCFYTSLWMNVKRKLATNSRILI